MIWVYSVIAALLSFTIHALAIKALGEKFPPSFVAPVFYTFAVIFLYGIYAIERPKVDMAEVMQVKIMLPLILAGVTIALTDYFFVKSLNQGAPLSLALPLLQGGSVALICIGGIVLFKEDFNLWKALGILMTICGIALIYKK
jgi:multidrug transporter EmrE-like cation transporter